MPCHGSRTCWTHELSAQRRVAARTWSMLRPGRRRHPLAVAVSKRLAHSGASEEAVREVVRVLMTHRVLLADELPRLPRAPGLYAVHGSAATWTALNLGEPPDDRPLYVGKSESSLHSRDVMTHFGNGRTGSSTVRRSFAALLRQRLDLRGVPRNRAAPERCANYGLTPEHDTLLTQWMRSHLQLAVWPKEITSPVEVVGRLGGSTAA